jgi:hypothetical protein
MNHSELKVHVLRAIGKLDACDKDMFTHDVSEWAIAHRLAVYLEQEIPGWSVDCEYNRQGLDKDPKAMSNGKNVRPDITLHHRGQMEAHHNLLVVEIKKRGEADSDMRKACEYTKPPEGAREFQYQFGLALSVVEGRMLRWFTEGKEISTKTSQIRIRSTSSSET